MKKYILLILGITIPLACAFAQGLQRKTHNPGFFIPQGALSSSTQPEKLPPVEYMNYNARSNTNIQQRMQMQQQQYQKQIQSQQTLQLQEQKNLSEPVAAQIKQPALKPDTSDTVKPTENKPEKPVITEPLNPKKIVTSNSSETKLSVETVKNNKNKQPIQGSDNSATLSVNTISDKLSYEKIIAEYRNEITAISQNKPKRNQRLIDMIADYRDMPHEI